MKCNPFKDSGNRRSKTNNASLLVQSVFSVPNYIIRERYEGGVNVQVYLNILMYI